MENIYLIRKTVQYMATLMETLVAQQAQLSERSRTVTLLPDNMESMETADGDAEAELMTIKEAAAQLNVSRYTVDAMRKRGDLTSIRRNGRVRLMRNEVLAARKWYSVLKGKV